jgi:hypothetical protein
VQQREANKKNKSKSSSSSSSSISSSSSMLATGLVTPDVRVHVMGRGAPIVLYYGSLYPPQPTGPVPPATPDTFEVPPPPPPLWWPPESVMMV